MDERGDVMSLVIYYKREAVPCEIQEFNDSYFDIFTPLEDNSLTREILRDIDQAEYLDKDGFSGRSKSGMWISGRCARRPRTRRRAVSLSGWKSSMTR